MIATSFDRTVVERWRRDARSRWAGVLPGDAPPGWSVSPLDPAVVLEAFPALALRPGSRLAAYVYRAAGNGNAVVYAIGADTELPPIDPRAEAPPLPSDALDDKLDAVTGDGSPESYLQASILARELDELGAVGHGMRWVLSYVLDDDAWDDPGPISPSRSRPALPPQRYSWTGRVPDHLHPTVTQDDGIVVVRFVTYSALGREEIVEHRDVYADAAMDSYSMHASADLLASSDGGYVI